MDTEMEMQKRSSGGNERKSEGVEPVAVGSLLSTVFSLWRDLYKYVSV